MWKKYFVSFAFYTDNCYTISSREAEIYVTEQDTPGHIAQLLEGEVAAMQQDQSVVILNFWEM